MGNVWSTSKKAFIKWTIPVFSQPSSAQNPLLKQIVLKYPQGYDWALYYIKQNVSTPYKCLLKTWHVTYGVHEPQVQKPKSILC